MGIWCRRTFGRVVALGWLILGGLQAGLAHDIPNARIERSTQVRLTPGRLVIDYEVVLSELTLAQDLRQLDGESFVGDRAALFERYAQIVGPLNGRGLLLRVDDQEVDLQPIGSTIQVEDHPRFRFRFAASIPERGRLAVVDTNYASSEGGCRLALAIDPAMQVTGDLPPDRVETIPFRASWEATAAEERRARRLTVSYTPQPTPRPTVEAISTAAVAAPVERRSSGMTHLLDRATTTRSVGWFAVAFLLGMVHALQPGHGKMLVAAASLDGRFAARRGVLLGLITAASHLTGVVTLAGLLWVAQTQEYGSIHRLIARVVGFGIAAVGCFRVGRLVGGVESAHQHRVAPMGIWAMGLAFGLIPCWDGVALVVVAYSIGQLVWGLTLLAWFSLGLAVVLVGVGWGAGRVQEHFRARPGWNRGRRWLGVASGLVLAGIGLGLLSS